MKSSNPFHLNFHNTFSLHPPLLIPHISLFTFHSSFFIPPSSFFPYIINVDFSFLLCFCQYSWKRALNFNFFLKTFGGLLNFIYLCTRFPKIFRLAYLRNSFFEKIYIDRSSTRSTFLWTARFFMGCFFGTGCMRQTVRFNWTSFSYRFYFLLQ